MTTQGLYDSSHEHDACGVGFVANIRGIRSHAIISMGLEVLRRLTHRGAVGADILQGDGAGVLIQIPDKLYRDDLLQRDIVLPPPGEYGVGMVFLPQEKASRHACMEEIERAIITEGQKIIGWREVPVDLDMPMSEVVRAKMPVIRQVFVAPSRDVVVTDAFERKLYVIRKRSSIAIANLHLRHGQEFYIPSFSARTVVYKGQVLAHQVGIFYKDLCDTRTESALILLHQRFSTNTFPRWSLAHPFRYIAHNGEINTLRGNFNWILAREKKISSPILGDDLHKLWPLIFQGQSDSASFDNALELLVMAGYPLAQAMMMMIPEAWERNRYMQQDVKAFYKYHACMMEPWDGPAVVTFTDGRQVGAQLDRNGLRPARYIVTEDDLVILASETGALDIPDSRILRKWRLEPGKILLIDLEQGRIIDNQELKNTLATAKPYREWVERISINIDQIPGDPVEERLNLPREQALRVFAYCLEDINRILRPMAANAIEPTMSMGNDEPLAVLSSRPRVLYDYFRQLFAQVTNPPIDPIRELLVTSLISFIGPKPDLLNIIATAPSMRIEVPSPILTADKMEKLRHIGRYTSDKFVSKELDITYPLEWGARGIEARLASLRAAAVDAVKAGVNILILTDRAVCRERVAIPALLALSSIHLWLVDRGLRTSTGLVVETGSAFNNHHFALLAGYGAEAIYPYLALMTVADLGGDDPAARERCVANYLKAVDKGLAKIMSKMGISTYMSYIGAQIFEAVGLSRKCVDRYFTNTPTHIEGIGLFEIAEEQVRIHERAFDLRHPTARVLATGGHLNFRYDGEDHLWTPEAVISLQKAVREDSFEEFQRFSQLTDVQSEQLRTLRGLLELHGRGPIELSAVRDSEEDIIRRFTTAAMSIGAISTEAHTALAIAMNRLGGMSNSGEGGEDPRRNAPITTETTLRAVLGDVIEIDQPLHPGDSLRSRVKQVASGRFGVTSTYLASGDLLQIKMAQGAKPGEGGQLPGHKVTRYIGFLRNSVPGIGLVSPPPHHDIYSIEDLAQLIYDLKLANTRADISVKLVAEVGIGTVAAGVAKCKADHITVSGHDGGTGASPYSSIKFAGSAWEIGLAEVQQTLVLNRLRSRVRLQVDGQIKTGRDVVIGALLGADEFGFGTAPLVTLGCVMMRKCHTNNCPAGVASQDPELRRQFIGRPEYVERYFHFVAREVRQLMAQLGFERFDDMVGHVECLRQRACEGHDKARFLSFEKILYQPRSEDTLHQSIRQDHELEKAFDHRHLAAAIAALESGTPLEITDQVTNINRSIGTMISGEAARRPGTLADNFITLTLTGRAGQSLGAFLHRGVTVSLEGEANDYVGKGLSGGIIRIFKPRDFRGAAEDNIIAGNTCLYGATSGEAYVSGVAGERFAVRNSGALAVVEGVGEHGCEYMTGGTVVVLGRIGRNFGSGMSGGVAYIYDPSELYRERLADNDFRVSRVSAAGEPGIPLHLGRGDAELLRGSLEAHVRHTGSERARTLLEHFDQELGNFVKIMPNEYIRALSMLAREQ